MVLNKKPLNERLLQTVEKVGLPQKNYLSIKSAGEKPLTLGEVSRSDGEGESLTATAFRQNEPCRTLVLSAFILTKYTFLFRHLPACR